MQLIQLGYAFVFLASASGLALRPQTRALHPSLRNHTSLSLQDLKGSGRNISFPLTNLAVTPAQNSQGAWTKALCDQNSIDDATVDYADRWVAADVPGAWNDMLNTWNNEARDNLYRGLTFSQFASYYFDGPEQWRCQDVGSVPCSTTVQCKDVNHPAGYLLLNAFSGVHQLHSEMHSAIHTAMVEIQSKIGEFSTTFAPQSDDKDIILAIFDILTTFFGFSISGMFNVVEKDIAKAATSIKKSSGSSKKSGDSIKSDGSSTKSNGDPNEQSTSNAEGKRPANQETEGDKTTEGANAAEEGTSAPKLGFNAGGYAYDMSYQLLAITAAWTRNHAPKVHDKLGAQNSLSSTLGDLFTAWKDLEVSYLEEVFSGDQSSQSDLQNLIGDGQMNFMPNHLDQNEMAAELKSVLYGQLMPSAWKTASDGKGAHPIVVKTDISCDDKSARVSEMHDYAIMTDEDAAKTRACWKDKLVFLVNANEWDFFNQVRFTPLPGTDSQSLSGGNWGNITVDDIVSSAMAGYEERGNSRNGYKAPEMDDIVNDKNANSYGKRVRYPGFFNMPVCESVDQARRTIMANHHANSPYWPCADPPNLNKDGTTIHVNKGYITVNGDKPVCDTFKISDPGYGETLNATFYGRLDGSNTADNTVDAKCKFTASWPKSYGDVYYGEDNCLYGRDSQPINGQDGNPACCNEDDNLNEKITNPYMVGIC